MKVYEAVELISEFGSEVLFGKKGLTRKVSSVEVLEIPQIEEWITPNTLVLTTMYSIKDDINLQYELIKSLIDNQASGLIVKLGRFVETLPEAAVQLAEDNDFPIILLPLDIHFYKVLNVLIKNIDTSAYQDDFDQIQGSSYERVSTLMNDIFQRFKVITYVESLKGELLFSGSYKIKDVWRNDNKLYSLPKIPHAKSYLDHINEKYTEYRRHAFHRIDELNRIIIPLFSQGSRYGLLHVVYQNRYQKEVVLNPVIFKIVDKIHVSLMSEMISIQNKKMYREELYQYWKDEGSDKLLLHVHLNKIEKIPTLFDPSLLAVKEIEKIIAPIQELSNYYFSEKQEGFIVLLSFQKENIISTEKIRLEIESNLGKSKIDNAYISISSPFKNVNDIESRANLVRRIVQIGKRIYPETQVFSFNKLGIYAFLLKLSHDGDVADYVASILNPLKELDESLTKTLKTYIQVNGNASEAAKDLFLNRRTVTYHLKKIKEQCHWDLNDAETIFILQFCLSIDELQ